MFTRSALVLAPVAAIGSFLGALELFVGPQRQIALAVGWSSVLLLMAVVGMGSGIGVSVLRWPMAGVSRHETESETHHRRNLIEPKIGPLAGGFQDLPAQTGGHNGLLGRRESSLSVAGRRRFRLHKEGSERALMQSVSSSRAALTYL